MKTGTYDIPFPKRFRVPKRIYNLYNIYLTSDRPFVEKKFALVYLLLPTITRSYMVIPFAFDLEDTPRALPINQLEPKQVHMTYILLN